MKINNKRLSEWEYNDIQLLIENPDYLESDILDYKEKFDTNDEFKNDVCSFANNSGGYLFYGIKEKRDGKKKTGLAGELVGIDNMGEDDFNLKIGNALSASIEPLRPNFEIKVISIANDKCILVIHIIEGYAKPYFSKQTRKFLTRGNSGKEDMSYLTIQDLFHASFSTEDRLRGFIDKRNQFLQHENNPPSIYYFERPYVLYHFIPMHTLVNKVIRYPINDDLHWFQNNLIHKFPYPWRVAIKSTVNADGVLLTPASIDMNELVHIQIFWNGSIELATTSMLEFVKEETSHIPGYLASYAKCVLNIVCEIFEKFQIDDQIAFSMYCNNVQEIKHKDYDVFQRSKPRNLFDRKELQTPFFILSSSNKEDFSKILLPFYDELGFLMGFNNFSQNAVNLVEKLI